jgi:ankyrin repeat protein
VPDIVWSLRNSNGETALDIAKAKNRTDIVQLFEPMIAARNKRCKECNKKFKFWSIDVIQFYISSHH